MLHKFGKIKTMSRTATITRGPSTENGTFGDYLSDSGYKCKTLERPVTGPHPCIPAGTYHCSLVNSPSKGRVYGIMNVSGREYILIHSANWYTQLLGCVAPGAEVGSIMTPDGLMLMGVSKSRLTLAALMADMKGEDFNLTITEDK